MLTEHDIQRIQRFFQGSTGDDNIPAGAANPADPTASLISEIDNTRNEYRRQGNADRGAGAKDSIVSVARDKKPDDDYLTPGR